MDCFSYMLYEPHTHRNSNFHRNISYIVNGGGLYIYISRYGIEHIFIFSKKTHINTNNMEMYNENTLNANIYQSYRVS